MPHPNSFRYRSSPKAVCKGSPEEHASFQDPEKFLELGGRRGKQIQVLTDGTYTDPCLIKRHGQLLGRLEAGKRQGPARQNAGRGLLGLSAVLFHGKFDEPPDDRRDLGPRRGLPRREGVAGPAFYEARFPAVGGRFTRP